MIRPKQEAPVALFYEFSLEDHVPDNHLVCSIDRYVDLASVQALNSDCMGCELKAACCPNASTHSVHCDKYEIVRDFARRCTASDFNSKAQARRKKVEMLFAHLTRILGHGGFRLCGPCGVQDEFILAATTQNLRKVVKLRSMQPAVG